MRPINYFKIIINHTSRQLGSKSEGFRTYYDETIKRDSLEEVREYLRENYDGKTREKIYIGDGIHVGFIYKMGIESDWDSGKKYSYYRQDWVEVRKVSESNILVIKY